jgi:DNA-binding NarL/FixJ family response regulator
MTPEVTILIVDDHPLLRRGVRDVISESRQFRIVGEASDGEEAMRLVIGLKPQIAIVDIDMPRLNGLEMTRSLRQLSFSVKTIILTMYREEDMFNAAMDLGAKAYVLKDNAANDIMAALERVSHGDIFVSPSMWDAGRRRSDRVQESVKQATD